MIPALSQLWATTRKKTELFRRPKLLDAVKTLSNSACEKTVEIQNSPVSKKKDSEGALLVDAFARKLSSLLRDYQVDNRDKSKS
jgi:hypothetical protein